MIPKHPRKAVLLIFALLVLGLFLASCGSSSSTQSAQAVTTTTRSAAGASVNNFDLGRTCIEQRSTQDDLGEAAMALLEDVEALFPNLEDARFLSIALAACEFSLQELESVLSDKILGDEVTTIISSIDGELLDFYMAYTEATCLYTAAESDVITVSLPHQAARLAGVLRETWLTTHTPSGADLAEAGRWLANRIGSSFTDYLDIDDTGLSVEEFARDYENRCGYSATLL